MLARIAVGLREAVVELQPSASGHVGEHAVEDAPAAFRGVEPFVDEPAQEAAALGPPPGVGSLDARRPVP